MSDDLVDDVRRVICEARKEIPDGWKLVPLEPTEEMVIAGCRHENFGDMAGRYAAMLSAAPDLLSPPCSFPECTCHVAAKQSVELIESREKPSPAPDLVEEVTRAIEGAIGRKFLRGSDVKTVARAVIPLIVARERERCLEIIRPILAHWLWAKDAKPTWEAIASAIRSNTE